MGCEADDRAGGCGWIMLRFKGRTVLTTRVGEARRCGPAIPDHGNEGHRHGGRHGVRGIRHNPFRFQWLTPYNFPRYRSTAIFDLSLSSR
jgi:hypothetical protein